MNATGGVGYAHFSGTPDMIAITMIRECESLYLKYNKERRKKGNGLYNHAVSTFLLHQWLIV